MAVVELVTSDLNFPRGYFVLFFTLFFTMLDVKQTNKQTNKSEKQMTAQ